MKKLYTLFAKSVFVVLFCLFIQHVSAAPTITITITSGTIPTTGTITITATGTTGTVTYAIKRDTAANFPTAQASNQFLNLAGGKYVAAVYDDSGVAPSDTITIFYGPGIKFTGANNIIIDGGNPVDTTNPGNNLLVFDLEGIEGTVIYIAKDGAINGKNIVIKNSEIRTDSNTSEGYKGIVSEVDSVAISGCYIDTTYIGIEVANAKTVNILNNYVRNNGHYGAFLNGHSSSTIDFTIDGNLVADGKTVFADTAYSGIAFGSTAQNGEVKISNNTVKNITNDTLATGQFISGIQNQSTTFTGKMKITGNTVFNIANQTKSATIAGIQSNAGTTDSLIIQGNTITNLQNQSTANTNNIPVYGIYVNNTGNTPVVLQRNSINSLQNSLYNASGIYIASNTATTPFSVINNMISEIGVVGTNNTSSGISVNGALAQLYHNSIRIGNQTGGAGIYGIQIDATSTSSEIKNNIIYVENNFNPANDTLLSIQSVPSALSKNVYYKSENAASIGNYLGTSYQNINSWNMAVNDNSIVYQPQFMATNNLHLDIVPQNDAHLIVPLLAGVVETDFDNDSRINCDNAAGADNFVVAATCRVENIRVTLPACMGDSVQINFEAIGGTLPFQYSLDGGITYTIITSIDSVMQSGNTALHFKDSLPYGNYTLSVKDANGCTFVDSIFSVAPNSPSIEPKTDILFVKIAPTGLGDGSSWDNAFDGKFLAWYLRNKAVDETEIYVAEGVYTPYVAGCDTMTNIRKYSFELNHNIQMKGGFDSLSIATDTILNYNPKTNITRLSGEIQGDSNDTNNSYHVVNVAQNVSIQLDGFFISNGYANGSGPDQNGGGILDNGGSAINVTYSHLVVEYNAADYGAGIYYNKTNQYRTARELIVQNNTDLITFGGAGIFAWGNLLLENSTVSNNINGSGIVSWGGDMLLRNSTISGNGKHGIEANNTQLNWLRFGLVNTTITNNTNNGVYLKNNKEDSLTISFDNTLITSNLQSDIFTDGGFSVNPITFAYTIIGNTKYVTNLNDIYPLPIPVTLDTLADNGGWGKTHALLNPCENPAVNSGDPLFSGGLDQRGVLRSSPPCIGAYDGLNAILITMASTPNDTVCEASTTTLQATVTPPTGVIVTGYQWYKNGTPITDSVSSAITFSNITLADAGKYTVLVTTDSTGCQRMGDTLILVVRPNAIATDITAVGDTVCYNATSTLTATSLVGNVFKWYTTNDPSSAPIATTATWTTGLLTSDTTFYVSVSSNTLCENQAGSLKSVFVKVNPLPTAIISPTDTAVCLGSMVTLSVDFTGTAPYTLYYKENNVNKNITTSDNPLALTYIIMDSLTVVLDSLSDVNGCLNRSLTGTATIFPPATATPVTATTPQVFCSVATVSDLRATGIGIKWYNYAGVLLSPATELIHDSIYYASQSNGECESYIRTAVKVVIDPEVLINSPSIVSPQHFCATAILSDIIIPSNAGKIVWYAQPFGGDSLFSTTVLEEGKSYYAVEYISGCQSTFRTQVTVVLDGAIPAPEIETPQDFCEGALVANIAVPSKGIIWYDAPTGGAIVPPTETLVDGGIYYASQQSGACASADRTPVTITLDGYSSPTAPSPQSICGIVNPTLSDLLITGAHILWYDGTTGDPLEASTTVEEEKSYIAVQGGNDGCVGDPITISITGCAISVAGTVFPFVHTTDAEFNAGFPVRVSLKTLPTGTGQAALSQLKDDATIVASTLAHNYGTSDYLANTPSCPGFLGGTDNAGIDIDYSRVSSMVYAPCANSLVLGDLPQRPIGYFNFANVAPGTYILEIKRAGFIVRWAEVAIAEAVDNNLGHRELILGNVNFDCEVTSADADIIWNNRMNYKPVNKTNYQIGYDLEGNKTINQIDFDLTRKKVGMKVEDYSDTKQLFIDYNITR